MNHISYRNSEHKSGILFCFWWKCDIAI